MTRKSRTNNELHRVHIVVHQHCLPVQILSSLLFNTLKILLATRTTHNISVTPELISHNQPFQGEAYSPPSLPHLHPNALNWKQYIHLLYMSQQHSNTSTNTKKRYMLVLLQSSDKYYVSSLDTSHHLLDIYILFIYKLQNLYLYLKLF